jgi:hypothetical protein
VEEGKMKGKRIKIHKAVMWKGGYFRGEKREYPKRT